MCRVSVVDAAEGHCRSAVVPVPADQARCVFHCLHSSFCMATINNATLAMHPSQCNLKHHDERCNGKRLCLKAHAAQRRHGRQGGCRDTHPTPLTLNHISPISRAGLPGRLTKASHTRASFRGGTSCLRPAVVHVAQQSACNMTRSQQQLNACSNHHVSLVHGYICCSKVVLHTG